MEELLAVGVMIACATWLALSIINTWDKEE